MKTYGQIDYEARDAYFTEHGGEVFKATKLEWDKHPTPLAKGACEAGAQAVIAEFCARNDIIITPEED